MPLPLISLKYIVINFNLKMRNYFHRELNHQNNELTMNLCIIKHKINILNSEALKILNQNKLEQLRIRMDPLVSL